MAVSAHASLKMESHQALTMAYLQRPLIKCRQDNTGIGTRICMQLPFLIASALQTVETTVRIAFAILMFVPCIFTENSRNFYGREFVFPASQSILYTSIIWQTTALNLFIKNI